MPEEQSPIAMVQRLTQGLIASFPETEHPASVHGLTRGTLLINAIGAVDMSWDTAYGIAKTSDLNINADGTERLVRQGEYFCIPYSNGLMVECINRETGKGDGEALVVVRHGFKGLPSVGGPVEAKGRLKYIDGCSDSLLIGPPLLGDPCFNLLHFPAGIDQTAHTHPTIRAGIILSGEGECRTAHGDKPLRPGDVFVLYPDAIHAFSTLNTDGMTLVVFHPDTDTGPSHDDHPMLNRTIVDGVSAATIDEIRTTDL